MKIKLLSPLTISRIAAGEVIERPASAIKELIENSIDAFADEISILINQSGRNLIMVSDNGAGMSKDDLELSVDRHTTSKLDEEDIFNIKHFGFRGEALPSIASVSRVNITTKHQSEDLAYSIDIFGGEKGKIYPSSLVNGTKIEVRDLFFATPARLKFLKSEKLELQYIIEIINKISIANYSIGFTLSSENKQILKYNKYNSKDEQISRINDVIGKGFSNNSIKIYEIYGNIKIHGFISKPNYNRANSNEQYFFINNRPIKDKILSIAIRIAYQDFIASDRYPSIVIFIDLPTDEVDVNVHPTKSEVRFRDVNHIRSILINIIKSNLSRFSGMGSQILTDKTINKFEKFGIINNYNRDISINKDSNLNEKSHNYSIPMIKKEIPLQSSFFIEKNIAPIISEIKKDNIKYDNEKINDLPLGIALCQLYNTYIISQTEDSIIIVDQHAVHERLVYENLKKNNDYKNKRQRLLIPAIVSLDQLRSSKIFNIRDELLDWGLSIDKFGNDIIVNEIPSIIEQNDICKIINDIADDLVEYDLDISTNKITEHILESFACYNSIRSGRKLNIDEMNKFLRDMENNASSEQCNHGRPTYIKLKLTDIEKLFGRK